MSIEKNIERIAVAVEALLAIQSKPVTTIMPDPVPVAAQPTPAPIPAAEPQPAPAPSTSSAPFSTPEQMQKYVTDSYGAMGPEKGNKMIGILKEMGVDQIKNLRPDQYSAFYEKVEALKAS